MGVDLNDQFDSHYRINIRSKKWWWPCFSCALNSAMVNSRSYYRLLFSNITTEFLMFYLRSLLVLFGKLQQHL